MNNKRSLVSKVEKLKVIVRGERGQGNLDSSINTSRLYSSSIESQSQLETITDGTHVPTFTFDLLSLYSVAPHT